MYDFKRWGEPADKHVVMLSNLCCIRVQKQAHALRAKGWRVDSLSCHRPADVGAFDYSFTTAEENLPRRLRESGASIIHVHNEPDKLMRYADAGAKGRPVVYDCHDLEYNRFQSVTADERYAFARADGVVSVSAAHRDFAYSLHPWDVPSAVTMSLPLRKFIPAYSGPRSGVMYQGGLSRPGRCSWRDLSVPCAEFAEAGIQFDIFCREDMRQHYPNVVGFLPYDKLLTAISRHSYGVVGHDPAHPVYQQAMPNKLWEYAACGCIPLMLNALHAAEVFGSGIVATDTRDAIAQMRECDEDAMRADVLAHARFMDDEIDNTIALYETLLGDVAA